MKPTKIEISHKTIIFAITFFILFTLSLNILWRLRSLLVMVFICLVFMGALNPSVKGLVKMKIPRPLAIIILYFVLLLFLSFGVAGIVPILVDQTAGLINNFPNYIENTTFFGAKAIDLSNQFKIIENLPSNIARITISLFSNIFSGFVIFIITFYLLIERQNLPKYSFSAFGAKGRKKTILIIEEFEKRIGRWVNAQLFLMLIIGVLSYIGYLFIGLKYVVPLAILAGLLEIVPNIGPTISTVLAALVGLTISPITALSALIWGIVVQQLENNFIVPKIMKESVGLNPLVTILLIAAGSILGGIMGAILAIPLYLTTEVLFHSFFDQD